MICLCLTGESFAQSVMCPFLYYMVRDFHVGKDMWIGYYAGLLWTGFWSANLVTTMLWGYLSDKYGRKVVMVFGLFMTSISTLCLGLSTCYHDAMMALVVQGACTSLIPVSKCAIGEIANRQQQLYDAQIVISQQRSRQQTRRTQGPLLDEDMDVIDISETPMNEKISKGLHGEAKSGCEDDGPCSDPECCGSETDSEVNVTETTASAPKVDFASKGYSALVIALAIGAALGPLAGGNLTQKQIPGFESYPYFAPCLLASSVGLILTGIVALGLNESHPKWAKWAKPTEIERASARDANESSVNSQSLTPPRRGRSGYELARDLRESSTCTVTPEKPQASARKTMEMPATQCVDDTRGSTEFEACGARSAIQEMQPAPLACSCAIAIEPIAKLSEDDESFALSPATELFLVLTIYTLLVLTSILGSEFVMLYTQSSRIRGGLQYSAKIFGQVLTLRGIIKLVFNLFGYPWMVARIGVLKCLRLGILIIGFTAVFGLGLLVPWNVYKEDTSTWEQMQDMDHTGTGSGPGFKFEDGRSAGMGTILLCLSLISVGDVLGYISVLVLFGKSAERLKGVYIKNGATMLGDSANEQAQPATARGGSGVLWSVAQASANVMRLAAPVLAGRNFRVCIQFTTAVAVGI
ncbi:hypothetical protein BGZ70_005757 [Mortierella alpina]|uniref:Uncharacterized protein n=1 Tax=Mortierella alpina TaxID=64518 RepID=A0A9P6JAS2_MORAP|nr:hypothetical protein BGZ70_005757 [Mortierella alpina]